MRAAGSSLTLLLIAAAVSPALAAWPNDPLVNVPVCTAAGRQQAPTMLPDGGGGAIITWYDERISDRDIYAQRVLGTGVVDPAWPVNGLAVCTATGSQFNPTIVSDGSGGAIVTWYDRRSGTNYDIYAQHVLGSGTVDPAWPVNGQALCTAAADQFSPVIASDGAGGAVVVWRDFRGADGDVYAQRVLAWGAVDPGWPADGQALCTATGNQNDVTVVSDGAGGAIATWADLRGDSDIYAMRVLDSGVVDPDWPVDGLGICVQSDDQGRPTVVGDGAGGAVITWHDKRSGVNYDIYAMHVHYNGKLDSAWPAGGQLLCGAADQQSNPTIVSDGASGAIVTWSDFRSGSTYDIYAQHVRASGDVDPVWPGDGLPVCGAAGDQINPTVASDEGGGALISWYDLRSGTSYDIYAMRVLDSGVAGPSWPPEGRALSTAPGSQAVPVIVSDGSGGAVVAWQDARSGPAIDIYIQGVDRYGALGPPTVAVEHRPAELEFSLAPPAPNPAGLSATLRFMTPRAGRARLAVFDAAGRRVRDLVSGTLPAGDHFASWNGRDDSGRMVPSGLYVFRLEAGGRTLSRRLTVVH